MKLNCIATWSVALAALTTLSPLNASAAKKEAPAEIVFPNSISDFKVDDVKTVHASDFGFNRSNSTAAIQKALDSGATTVIVDAMNSPWYIDSVSPRSNQRILIRKGAKVLMDRLSPKRGKSPLFSIRQVKNVIIEGEGCGEGESFIGGYESYAERQKFCKWYGKSAIELDRSTNVVIRKLRIADSEEDGVFFGGDIRQPSVDTWLEDLDLDSHYRQACSICCADGVFCRRVKFRNTRGNEPSAGIDVEPAYPCSPNTRMYLYDCEFDNNNGGGIVFATCSDYPITFYARGCRFGPQNSSVIAIPARGEAYFPTHKKADVKIVFEDTTIETYSNVPAIGYSTAPLFDCTFRNLTVRDNGKMGPYHPATAISPIHFTLNRDYGKDDVPAAMVGLSTFDNVTIDGFGKTPLVAFCDELGKVSVKKAFKGKVKYNGQLIDISRFSHDAPDIAEHPLERVPVSRLAPPNSDAVKRPVKSNAVISWNGAWFQALPAYTYFFHAEKGAKISFKLTYPRKIVYEDMAKKLAGQHLVFDTPTGDFDWGEVKPGTNLVELTASSTGWHSFRPPCQDGEGNAVPVTDFTGAALSRQSDTLGDSLGKFVLADTTKDYSGYFEVPPGVECRLRVTWGSLELYDADGKLYDQCKQGEYVGRHTFKFRTKGDAPEVWRFRTPAAGGTRVLKFYAPLNGIWADSPETLPRDLGRQFDWNAAKSVARGIRVLERAYDYPRNMKTYLMRIDLKTPGLRFTGTERSADWGKPMPDVTNRVVKIETKRERTADFMLRRRAAGENMVAAFNSAPWGPWEKPFNHRYAEFDSAEISDGVNVAAHNRFWPCLVVWKNNTAVITNHIDEVDWPKVAVAHSGFATIMRNGVFMKKRSVNDALAPRTAYGISKDGRYLYVLAVDGRQKEWSRGADMYDLYTILSAAGASDALNVDGGGSTTLVYWDDSNQKPFIMNRHDPNKAFYRSVALSIGIVLE